MVIALVRIMEDRVVADSRDVATAFGKQHKDLLKRVDALLRDEQELRRNFAPHLFEVAQNGSAIRRYRRFDMDRKGFMLLVMGFTGEKALALKIAWIDAFDRMEQMLTDGAANDLAPPEASPFLDIREKLLFVREARTLGGRAAGRRAWTLAGLPDVFTGEEPAMLPGSAVLDEGVTQWLAERTERFDGRTQASVLYADYQRWCARDGLSPLPMKQFSAQLHGHGHHSRKSSVSLYPGLRLRGETK